MVEREQLEIGRSDIADNSDHDVAPGFLAGEELCASRFVEAADASPQIKFPGSTAGEKEDVGGLAAVESGKAVEGIFAARSRAAIIQLGEKEGAIFHEDGARLLDANDGDSQVVVVGERGANEFVEIFVFENFPPWKI